MAQRRMFSKQITNSSDFLMMAQSAQNLYFHFGMNADDDGFCEVFTIMRMTESKPDDLQALHSRGLIYVIDGKVCIVKDWHENNQIRSDRYNSSKYLDDPKYKEIYLSLMSEKINELAVYSDLLQDGNQVATKGNHSIGKVRLGKVRLGKDNSREPEAPVETKETKPFISSDQWHVLIDSFKPINPMSNDMYKNKTERSALTNLVYKLGYEQTVEYIKSLEYVCSQPYGPRITKPTELQRDLGKLILFKKQQTGTNKLETKGPVSEAGKYKNITKKI